MNQEHLNASLEIKHAWKAHDLLHEEETFKRLNLLCEEVVPMKEMDLKLTWHGKQSNATQSTTPKSADKEHHRPQD